MLRSGWQTIESAPVDQRSHEAAWFLGSHNSRDLNPSCCAFLWESFDPNLADPLLVEMTRVRPGVGDGEEDQQPDSMLPDSKGDTLLPSRGNLHNLKTI